LFGNHGTPATVALFLMFPLAWWAIRSKGLARGSLIVMFYGAFVAPQGAFIKLPSFPIIDRQNMPYLCTLLVMLAVAGRAFWRARPGAGAESLILGSMIGSLLTVVGNSDVLIYGVSEVRILPALDLNDGLSMFVFDATVYGVPFLIARAAFSSSRDLRALVEVSLAFTLLYAPPFFYELRMGPVVHTLIYGYSYTELSQAIRWGGYRPSVLTPHGLMLGLWLCHATVLAIVNIKVVRARIFGLSPTAIAWVVGAMFILSKSTGALAFGVVLVPLVLYASPRTQVKVAAFVGGFTVVYPLLRGLDLLPTDALVQFLYARFSPERALSLGFRFQNEDILLERARERLMFGWGVYGRNFTYDPIIGIASTIADGHWIILLGGRGVAGFLSTFLCVVWPIFQLRRRFARMASAADQRIMAGVALVLAFGTLDLIPNGLFSTYPYFLAGAASGLVAGLTRAGARAEAPAPSGRRRARGLRVGRPEPAPEPAPAT
jgi:hypothetical protein